MQRINFIRTGTWLTGALALLVSAQARQVVRVQLRDSVVPALAKSAVTSNLPDSQPLHLSIALNPRFPNELKAFCDSVSNPSSPNYRDFITPEQVGEQFRSEEHTSE